MIHDDETVGMKGRMYMQRDAQKTRAYIVGGGIAGLSSAVFLVRDSRVKGENIIVLEQNEAMGGSLDATGSTEKGYSMRGGRMFERHFGCTYDLLDSIPSTDDPRKSVKTEIMEFYQETRWNSRSRLISIDGSIIDSTHMGFNNQDRADMMRLMLTPEKALAAKRISDVFHPHFFETNYWFMWRTIFAFQTWHSAIEMKRYLRRFVHLFPMMADMSGIQLTRYNQNDSIVKPMVAWLAERKVMFETDTRVLDLDLVLNGGKAAVKRLICAVGGKERIIDLLEDDIVIVTNGSITASSSLGSMKSPPALNRGAKGGSWELWEKIAGGHPGFGNPGNFTKNIDESKWESFTVTTTSPLLKEHVEALTRNKLGRAGLLTFKDSGWLLTVNFFNNPRSVNQSPDSYVWWGYGLFPDRLGNYVTKKMADCSGEELLIEALGHLGVKEGRAEVLKSSICIPCMMPYITSQFMPRSPGDRPKVVPDGVTNLAFVGQYAEIPDDVVFTVEYSVRTAQTAVRHFVATERRPVPMYHGMRHPAVMLRALKTMYK
jgi:myosin-crossreactive antigen